MFSERPLSLDEAIDAIAIFPDRIPAFEKRNRMLILTETARYCSSVIKITTRLRKKPTKDDNSEDDDAKYDEAKQDNSKEKLIIEL